MKDKMIAYRASDQERKKLGVLAQFYGVSKSELIRWLVEREARDQADLVQVKPGDPVEMARSMRIGQ